MPNNSAFGPKAAADAGLGPGFGRFLGGLRRGTISVSYGETRGLLRGLGGVHGVKEADAPLGLYCAGHGYVCCPSVAAIVLCDTVSECLLTLAAAAPGIA